MQRKDEKPNQKKKSRYGGLPDPFGIGNVPVRQSSGPEFRSVDVQGLVAMGGPSASLMSARAVSGPAQLQRSILQTTDTKLSRDRMYPALSIAPAQVKPELSVQPESTHNFGRLFQGRTSPVEAPWNPKLRCVPSFYPMERSSRILRLSEHPLQSITRNIRECLRLMSVQAKFFDEPAGAALVSIDQVEMQLYLWETGRGEEVCVEIQRRRGDSVAFHRFGRHILEAAGNDFELSEFQDYSDSHYLKAAEKLLKNELAKAVETDESVVAIEVTSSLLKKDRMDARLLGMESLCILTDPRKSHMTTALMASRAVLLGSSSGSGGDSMEDNSATWGVNELIINLVQKKCMIDDDEMVKGMDIDYDSDDDNLFVDMEDQDNRPTEYVDVMNSMTVFALAVLANSWEVVTNFEGFQQEPEVARGSPESVKAMVNEFCINCMKQTDTDITFSLLTEVSKAERKPHNACLAAKILRVLCQSSRDVRDRALKLGATAAGKRAYEVGKIVHAKLEAESYQLMSVLNLP